MSNGTFSTLVTKYSNKEGFVEFDDFVACILSAKAVFGKLMKITYLCGQRYLWINFFMRKKHGGIFVSEFTLYIVELL